MIRCTLKFENHCCVYQSLGDLVKMHILIQWVWCGPEFLISGRHPSGDDVGPQTILKDQGSRSFAYKCYQSHVFNKKKIFLVFPIYLFKNREHTQVLICFVHYKNIHKK